MHRIDQDGHVDNKFAEGDPAAGAPPTRVGADWLNAVQEEIALAVEGGGKSLAKENNGQLAEVLAAIRNRANDTYFRFDAEDEVVYPAAKTRGVLVPLHGALPFATAGEHAWVYGLDSELSASERVWMGTVQGEILELEFGHLIPSGGVPLSVQLLVKPSGARASNANRMLAEVVRQTHDFRVSPSWAGTPTSIVLASARDNGTDTLQVVNLNLGEQPEHDRSNHHLFVRITAGQMVLRLDDVAGVRVLFTDPGPRNA